MFNNLFNLTRTKIKKIHIFISTILITSTFCGTLTAFAEGLFQVSVVIDGKWHVYNTMSSTIEELFKKEQIEIHQKDIVDKSLKTQINKDMTIYINKAENVTFVIDGKEQVPFVTNQQTVGLAINEFCKETGKNVYLIDKGQSSAANVKKDVVINVSTFKEQTKTITEQIPFDTKTVENPNLSYGKTVVKTQGVNGVKETVVKETYKNDELVSTEVVSEKITKQPVTQVIEKGTKQNVVKTDKGTFTFTKKMTMKSTAYTAGPESTGKSPGDAGYGITASGMKAQKGVVAVDTKVIPFGTKLYIEGYGYAVAGDTGSAIKGNKIDVFFNDYTDAINYGVKNVNVYVLDEKIS